MEKHYTLNRMALDRIWDAKLDGKGVDISPDGEIRLKGSREKLGNLYTRVHVWNDEPHVHMPSQMDFTEFDQSRLHKQSSKKRESAWWATVDTDVKATIIEIKLEQAGLPCFRKIAEILVFAPNQNFIFTKIKEQIVDVFPQEVLDDEDSMFYLVKRLLDGGVEGLEEHSEKFPSVLQPQRKDYKYRPIPYRMERESK